MPEGIWFKSAILSVDTRNPPWLFVVPRIDMA
jgi:hypothetical protein